MGKGGIGYILISSLCYVVVNICVKYLHHIPTHEIVFFRCIISLAISIVWIRQMNLPFFGNNKKWLVIRGLSGATALFMFFVTIKEMPLASATTIQYVSPVFTVFLAVFIQGEKVRPIQWVFGLIALLGVFLIKGFDERISYFYLGVGILSALISGIAYNAIMKCRETDHPLTVVMYFPLVATPVMAIGCFFEWVTPVGMEWLILLTLGVFTQMAQLYMTKALHAGSSSRIMPFKYFGAVYALIIGYLVFDERLQFISLIGMALVVSGVILNTFVRERVPIKEPPGTHGVV